MYEVVDGVPRQLHSWAVAAKTRPAYFAGKIYTLEPFAAKPLEGVTISVRDQNGKLEKSIAVPKGCVNLGGFVFRGDVLFNYNDATKSLRYFDLRYERPIDTDEWFIVDGGSIKAGYNNLRFIGPYDDFASRIVAPYQLIAYDRSEGKSQEPVTLGVPFTAVEEAEPGTWVVPSTAYGFSIAVVNTQANRLERFVAPYRWVALVLPVVAVAYLIWAWLWLQASLSDGGSAWLDSIVLGGLPLICMVVRAEAVQSGLAVHLCVVSICTAAVAVAAVWLVFGNTRLPIRCVPLAVVFLFVVRWAMIYGWPEEEFDVGQVAFFIGSTLGILAVLTLFKCFGLRIKNITEVQIEASGGPVRLLDYCGMTAIAACMASLVVPMLKFESSVMVTAAALFAPVGGLPLLAFAFALIRVGWLFCVGLFLAGLGYLLLVGGPLYQFCTGELRGDGYYLIISGAGLAGLFVCTFAAFLPFRLRGWRIVVGREGP